MDAEFYQGSPIMIDYIPEADVSAGDVVQVGDILAIAHRDIDAGELGALAYKDGVYRVLGDQVFEQGVVLYWDFSTDMVTPDVTSADLVFGYAASACAGSGEECYALHDPSAR